MDDRQRETAEQMAHRAILSVEQQAYPLDVHIDALSLIGEMLRSKRNKLQQEYGLGYVKTSGGNNRAAASGEFTPCARCNSVGGYYIEDRYRTHAKQTWVTCATCRGAGYT